MRYFLVVAALFVCATAGASVVAIGPAVFPAGSPLLDFNALATGTEVNGLIVAGVTFSYTVGGVPANGAVIIDGGPGTTNNIAPQNIVSIGNDTGTLGILLPTQATGFGYGFAILNTGTVPSATTISLFLGAAPVGSLSYPGSPDPTFSGGFAGVQSTLPFNRVELTFNAAAAPAFAVDNVRYVGIPEPGTLSLLATAALLTLVRRRS